VAAEESDAQVKVLSSPGSAVTVAISVPVCQTSSPRLGRSILIPETALKAADEKNRKTRKEKTRNRFFIAFTILFVCLDLWVPMEQKKNYSHFLTIL